MELGEQTLHFANSTGNKIRSYEVSSYNSIIIQLTVVWTRYQLKINYAKRVKLQVQIKKKKYSPNGRTWKRKLQLGLIKMITILAIHNYNTW